MLVIWEDIVCSMEMEASFTTDDCAQHDKVDIPDEATTATSMSLAHFHGEDKPGKYRWKSILLDSTRQQRW